MVIKASASAEIRALMLHLQSADAMVRDGAVARLAVIGSRAVDRLIDLYATTSDVATRLAILQTLEAIGDHRAEAVARRALSEGREVGVAAAAVLRRLLASTHDGAATGAFDALVAATLDHGADRRTRLAAFEALQDTPEQVRGVLAEVLRRDADEILRARAGSTVSGQASADQAVWADALEGRLPDTPATLHALVSAHAPAAPLTMLQRLIESLRLRETSGPDAREWTAVRGSLHQALAMRRSRVALYDLRETVARSTGPLPVSFLSALQSLGDASCLEELAAAWSHASATEEQWRNQIGLVFRAIARREHLTRRHAIVRRIASRWPDAAALMPGGASTPASTPSRTRPRQAMTARSARRTP